MWTPWGPREMSYIERCPHFRGEFIYLGHSKVCIIKGCPIEGFTVYNRAGFNCVVKSLCFTF